MPKPTLFFLYSIAIPILVFLGMNHCNAFPSSTAQELSSEPSLPPYVYLEKADSLESEGFFEETISHINNAQSIYRDRQEWEAYINCFSLLSKKYLKRGNTTKSMISIQTAIDTSNYYLYEYHPIYAQLFQQKGEIFLTDFQIDSASVYIKKAIELFSCEKDWVNYAWNKSILGIIAFYAEEYDNMECNLDDALKMAEVLENKNDELEISAFVLQSLGVLYELKGDYDKALQVSQNALFIQTNTIQKADTDSSNIGSLYNNMGAVFFAKGDYEQSINFLERSMLIFKKITGPESIDCAEIYANIGLGHLYQKEFEEAQDYFYESLEITKNDIKDREIQNTLTCYHNLSQSYFDLGIHDSSFFFAQKALEINQTYQWNLDLTYTQLGTAYSERGNYLEALQWNQKALKIRKERFGERSPLVAVSYKKMAEIHYGLNEVETALSFCQKALTAITLDFDEKDIYSNPSIKKVNGKKTFQQILELKGELLSVLFNRKREDIDLLEGALNSFELAIQVIDKMRQNFQAEESKHTLAANALSLYEKSIEAAIDLSNWHTQKKDTSLEVSISYLKKAFQFAEKNKATILLEAIKESKARLFANIPSQILEREEDLKRDMAFYERKLFEEKQKPKKKADSLKISFWESKIFDLTQAYQGLTDTLERDYPEYYNLKYTIEVASVEDIQEKLQENEGTLLEYFVGKKEVYVFVISADDIEVHNIDNTKHLQEQFGTLLKSLRVNPFQMENKEDAYLTYLKSAHWIYKNLVEDMLPSQKKDDEIGQLIVIPDGIMGYIPFETLLMEYPKDSTTINFSLDYQRYLIEEYSISYAYSTSLLLESLAAESSTKEQNYVGFAPVFERQNHTDTLKTSGSCLVSELQPLEGSAREVEQLSEMLKGSRFLKEEANKQNFMGNGANGRILHLATHACLSQADPMFNTIHFINDYLSTYELFNIRLDVDLAILSACNTGAGTLIPGEGIMSLSRGFLYAGCPSMVTSLWNASDNATVSIMLNLHANLFEGQSKSDALRSAKLQYLQNKPNRLSAPYFWATFVHIGNPNPISLRYTSSSVMWTLFFAAFGTISVYLVVRFIWGKD